MMATWSPQRWVTVPRPAKAAHHQQRERHPGVRNQNEGPEGNLFAVEGVAVGGAFDSDTATGMMPIAHRIAGVIASR
jgi:hypothetical protein